MCLYFFPFFTSEGKNIPFLLQVNWSPRVLKSSPSFLFLLHLETYFLKTYKNLSSAQLLVQATFLCLSFFLCTSSKEFSRFLFCNLAFALNPLLQLHSHSSQMIACLISTSFWDFTLLGIFDSWCIFLKQSPLFLWHCATWFLHFYKLFFLSFHSWSFSFNTAK